MFNLDSWNHSYEDVQWLSGNECSLIDHAKESPFITIIFDTLFVTSRDPTIYSNSLFGQDDH